MEKIINFYGTTGSGKSRLKDCLIEIFGENGIVQDECSSISNIQEGKKIVFSEMPLILTAVTDIIDMAKAKTPVKKAGPKLENMAKAIANMNCFRIEGMVVPATLSDLQGTSEDLPKVEVEPKETVMSVLEELSNGYFELADDGYTILEDGKRCGGYKYNAKLDAVIDFTNKGRPTGGIAEIRKAYAE